MTTLPIPPEADVANSLRFLADRVAVGEYGRGSELDTLAVRAACTAILIRVNAGMYPADLPPPTRGVTIAEPYPLPQ